MFILISISLFQSFNPLFLLRLNSKPSTLTFSFTGLTGYKGPIRNKSYISKLLFTVFQELGKFQGYRDFPSNCKSETLQKLSVLCLLGVCKMWTGYLRMADADLLRVIKKESKREMRMAKKKERSLSFKSLSHMFGPSHTYRTRCQQLAQLLLNSALPFIDVTETRTLRSSSLNAHMLGTLLL